MSIAQPRKQNINHRRVRGKHHKHDPHYLKAYHPYLPLLMLVIIGLAVNVFWSSQSKVLGATTALTAQALLTETNEERVRNSENSLYLSNKLSQAAQAKADDMVIRNYWSHATPDGKSPWSFLQNSGYSYQFAGENLAYGFTDSDGVITGWMNSSEHRANILNDRFREVGFGVASADNFQGNGKTTVVVAMYGTPATASVSAGATDGIETFASAQSFQQVSRMQLLAGSYAPWSILALIAVTMSAAIIFALRHVRAWRRLLIKGEAFVLHHKTLDFVVFSLIVIGVILSRTAGHIG